MGTEVENGDHVYLHYLIQNMPRYNFEQLTNKICPNSNETSCSTKTMLEFVSKLRVRDR